MTMCTKTGTIVKTIIDVLFTQINAFKRSLLTSLKSISFSRDFASGNLFTFTTFHENLCTFLLPAHIAG